jgi:hypothetical protein
MLSPPEKCIPACSAHSRAKAFFKPLAERRLAPARLAGDEDAHEAGLLGALLGDVHGVRRRTDERLRAQSLERLQHLFGVAGADRDMRDAERIEGVERGAGDERARVVGGEQELAGAQAAARIAAPRDRAPILEIVARERYVARRAARAARRIDARRLLGPDRGMQAERRRLGLARAQLVLHGERQLRDALQAADRRRRVESRRGQLPAIERGALEQPRDLLAIQGYDRRR